jgi:translation initiation factor IF-3
LRRNHNKRPQKTQPKNLFRKNGEIRALRVRLIDSESDKHDEISLSEAKALATSRGLDLVEVSPNARPPVVKIMDYGKYAYQEKQKLKAQKVLNKTKETKEVRFTFGIEEGDIQFKVNHIQAFLEKGHNVKISLLLRGRQMAFSDQARGKIEGVIKLITQLEEYDKHDELIQVKNNFHCTFYPRKVK